MQSAVWCCLQDPDSKVDEENEMKRRWIGFWVMLCMALLLSVTAYASEEPTYIFDHADIFTNDEETLLKWYAEEAETIHKIGLYVATVEDYKVYDEADVFEAARRYYILNDLGVGPEHGGLLLLLSMAERDFAMIAYGEYANTVFYDVRMEIMSEQFANKVSGSEGDMYDSCDYYLSWRLNDLETFRTNHRSEYRAFVRAASQKATDEGESEKESTVMLPSQETADRSEPAEELTAGGWVMLFGLLGIAGGCCVGIYKLLMRLLNGIFRTEKRYEEYDDGYEASQPVYRGGASPSVRVSNRTNIRVDNGLSYRDKRLMRRAMNAQINMSRRHSTPTANMKKSVSKTTSKSRGKFKGTSGKF